MTTFHEFQHEGKRYRFVFDEMHETRGSYGLETEAETLKAENEELDKLQSGEWVALGCIVSEPCNRASHCDSCSRWDEVDSVWGIVIENSHSAAEAFAKDGM